MLAAVVATSSFIAPVEDTASGVLKYHSDICVEVTTADGETKTIECKDNPNFFTDDGKNAVMDFVGGGFNGAAFSRIALCNVSTGLGSGVNKCYIANGLSNASGTFTKVSNPGNWSISNTFTSSADGQTVNGTALLNGSSTGSVFFANNSFNAVTLNTNDQITIRWNISIS